MPHLSKISIIEWNSLFSSWQMRLMPFRATQVDFPKREFTKFHIYQIYELTCIRLLDHSSSFGVLWSLFYLIDFSWKYSFHCLLYLEFFVRFFLGNTLSIVATDGSLRWRMGGGQEEVLNVRPVLHTRNTFCKTLKYSL